ncbi:MAG: ribosome maturation factor RimP [Elusimicrobia bacterium]|nr:ribosome maturation factor RimP [Elusimicrobiota bacterium]
MEEIIKIIEPALRETGYELVDVELMKDRFLRIYIDRASGGVTLDDCAIVSGKIGLLLDSSGIMDGGYNLEVSSPGVYRRLKKEKDFIKWTGSRVNVKLYEPVDSHRKLVGIIRGFESGILSLETEGRTLGIDVKNIAKANLYPEMEI